MHFFFFFNDTATTEIYTLSLHDALPIWTVRRGPTGVEEVDHPAGPVQGVLRLQEPRGLLGVGPVRSVDGHHHAAALPLDRKSTRLNSSHANISYAVFCLKKKNSQGMRLL